MSNDHAALVARLTDSLRSGLLFDNLDEPLDAYGKRIVRVVLAALSPSASEGAQATVELSAADQAAILDAIENPPEPNAALKRAFRRPAPAAGVREPEPSEALDLEALREALDLLDTLLAERGHGTTGMYPPKGKSAVLARAEAALARVKGQ
jgi:uncharacterized protein (DUF1778 family)